MINHERNISFIIKQESIILILKIFSLINIKIEESQCDYC